MECIVCQSKKIKLINIEKELGLVVYHCSECNKNHTAAYDPNDFEKAFKKENKGEKDFKLNEKEKEYVSLLQELKENDNEYDFIEESLFSKIKTLLKGTKNGILGKLHRK